LCNKLNMADNERRLFRWYGIYQTSKSYKLISRREILWHVKGTTHKHRLLACVHKRSVRLSAKPIQCHIHSISCSTRSVYVAKSHSLCKLASMGLQLQIHRWCSIDLAHSISNITAVSRGECCLPHTHRNTNVTFWIIVPAGDHVPSKWPTEVRPNLIHINNNLESLPTVILDILRENQGTRDWTLLDVGPASFFSCDSNPVSQAYASSEIYWVK
jgi:hypothetical protein